MVVQIRDGNPVHRLNRDRVVGENRSKRPERPAYFPVLQENGNRKTGDFQPELSGKFPAKRSLETPEAFQPIPTGKFPVEPEKPGTGKRSFLPEPP